MSEMSSYFARAICFFCVILLPLSTRAEPVSEGCNSAGTYLLKRAIERNDPDAKYALGKRMLEAPCTPSEQEEGFALLSTLASDGYGPALFDLGRMMIGSAETDLETEQGMALVHRSAQQGMAEAQALYGLLLISDATQEEDRHNALFWLGSAADNGVSHAAKAVSVMYARGMHGVTADACLAAIWNEAAILIDHPHAKPKQDTSSACRE